MAVNPIVWRNAQHRRGILSPTTVVWCQLFVLLFTAASFPVSCVVLTVLLYLLALLRPYFLILGDLGAQIIRTGTAKNHT